MLDASDKLEKEYQLFFESHPYLLGRLCSGIGGAGTIYSCLISQPKLDDIYPRVPDYVWFAVDSKYFRPIFIEIERPGKRYFKKNGEFTAEFLQAFGQLCCWRSMMTDPLTVQTIIRKFNLNERVAAKVVKPEYALLFGRREEYECSQYKCRMIASLETGASFSIRPYDDLLDKDPRELDHASHVVTCAQNGDKLVVIAVPDSFGLNNRNVDDYRAWTGFAEALDKNNAIHIERKNFLRRAFEDIVANKDSGHSDVVDLGNIESNSWL